MSGKRIETWDRGIGQVDISDIISKESKRIPQRWREGRLGVRRQYDSPELQAREMDENLEGGRGRGGGACVGRELFSSSSSGPWRKKKKENMRSTKLFQGVIYGVQQDQSIWYLDGKKYKEGKDTSTVSPAKYQIPDLSVDPTETRCVSRRWVF